MPHRDLLVTRAEAYAVFGDEPFSAADAMSVGISSHRLVKAARAGVLQRLRRGVYSVRGDALERARERISQLAARGIPACLGERSAADVWGIPQFGADGPLESAPLTLLVPRGRASRRGSRAGWRLREADLDPRDVVVHHGVPITTPLRTGLDVARHLGRSRRAALIPLCGGMRAEIVLRRLGVEAFVDDLSAPLKLGDQWITEAARDASVREEMTRDLARMVATVNRHRMRRVSEALHHVEPLLESWLEGVAWADLTASDLPPAIPQAWVRGASGRWLRGDFLIDGRVILEVDGATKYASQTPWEEKQRQSDLEAAGYWVVRCTWEELRRHPERVLARVRLALARSHAASPAAL